MDNYSIIDLETYAQAMRESAASSFEYNQTENLDDFISISQVISMIKEHSLGQDEEGNFIINEEIFENTFNDIVDWIYGVGLSKLAASGRIECAWDNDSNEMIFWLPNKDNISAPKE